MRVLVLSINYSPEPTGFAPHVTALCEHLARAQHEIVTITGFPFAPYWTRWDHEGRGWIAAEPRNHVQLFRVRHFIPRHPRRLLERLLMEGTFSALALWTSLVRVGMIPDVILYVGAQPSIAMVARWLGWWRRIPYVLAINDLAAQAAGDVGIVRRLWLARLLKWFERAAYRKATRALVLSEAFRNSLVADGFPSEHVRVVPCPIDLELIRPVSERESFRRRYAIERSAFVVLYAGSMGTKQDLHTIIDAARLLRNTNVIWVLVGEGELRTEIAHRVSDQQLSGSVRLLPFQAPASMAAMFGGADVLLLSQLAAVKHTVVPSKLLTYMASGRPVVAAVHPDSEAARLIVNAGGGVLVQPENPQALASAITRLQLNTEALAQLGIRNRRYAEANFDVRRIVELQEEVLRDAVAHACG